MKMSVIAFSIDLDLMAGLDSGLSSCAISPVVNSDRRHSIVLGRHNSQDLNTRNFHFLFRFCHGETDGEHQNPIVH
jgi:hypothetical protein